MTVSSSIQSLPETLVIGGGPAGVSAALRLHDLGHRVLLVDRATFPRDKVCGCCLNLSALTALARVRCDQLITAIAGKQLTRWELRLGDRRVEAPLPGGVAISRHAMDAALIDEATRRGVQTQMGCDAKVLDVGPEHVDVSLQRGDGVRQSHRFKAVVLATGLNGGGVSKWLPFTQSPSGPIGVGTILDSMELVMPQTIHMVCGATGYVGLVQLEDGRIDVAAAIRRTRADQHGPHRHEIAERIDALLVAAGMPPFAVKRAEFLRMTPPLTRSRCVGNGALIAVGDAATYVEPFTGEGMAWAIQSGIEAADCIAERMGQGLAAEGDLATIWAARYRVLARRRQWICRMMSGILGSETWSGWLVPAIRVAPWTAKMTISRLNRVTN